MPGRTPEEREAFYRDLERKVARDRRWKTCLGWLLVIAALAVGRPIGRAIFEAAMGKRERRR